MTRRIAPVTVASGGIGPAATGIPAANAFYVLATAWCWVCEVRLGFQSR
jgi:hypothetical protein